MGAPLNPAPNVLKVVVGGTAGGRPWNNIIHFQYSGSAPANSTCATIANAFQISWSSNVASLCPSPIVNTQVVVTDLTSPTSGEGQSDLSTPGTRGDDTLTGNAAVLISYPVQDRFKGGHPRTYLLALGNADNASTTQWSASTTGATGEVTLHWRNFLTAMVGQSFSGTTIAQFGFVRYHGKFLPNGGPPHYYLTTPQFIPLQINQAVAQTEVASQRRRIGRVRR